MQDLSGSSKDYTKSSVWEIEEEEFDGVPEIRVVIPRGGRRAAADGECVYVAVGKKNSSVEALSWALKHVATQSSLVYLVHVFPEVHYIPTPLGKFPKDQMNSQQVETYMNKERTKRRQMLQKLTNLCQAYKVEVETLLVESDLVEKAVNDLIRILNIKMLIVGATKSHRRRQKGSSKSEQIQRIAPQYCEVKIICNGKEVASPPPSDTTNFGKIKNDSISCNCFSRKLKQSRSVSL